MENNFKIGDCVIIFDNSEFIGRRAIVHEIIGDDLILNIIEFNKNIRIKKWHVQL